ncbi:MAG: hypothetical protein IH830_06425 [Planctomycetes bacterium]|nr:hypothetical protein [Planctomycetota bacterium]
MLPIERDRWRGRRGSLRFPLDHCDHIVKVPMAPGVDSLNVAVAAAVCLHRFSTAVRV